MRLRVQFYQGSGAPRQLGPWRVPEQFRERVLSHVAVAQTQWRELLQDGSPRISSPLFDFDFVAASGFNVHTHSFSVKMASSSALALPGQVAPAVIATTGMAKLVCAVPSTLAFGAWDHHGLVLARS